MPELLGDAGKVVIKPILPDSPLFDNYCGGAVAITNRSFSRSAETSKE
jgi:hypothetical protein